ncbi:MAG: hypothetical protein F4118_10950 [Acidimicrobiaceae bacterium]|nr:hypothetical protein [Acidimicrobiaceae bacterium]
MVDNTDAANLQSFATDHAKVDPMIYIDDHKAYVGSPNRRSVCHSVAESLNGQAHVNGWVVLKFGEHGTRRHASAKHLGDDAAKFAGRRNRPPLDTHVMMQRTVAGTVGSTCPTKNVWRD